MTDGIKALVKAQTEMERARAASKNPHFKSNYADLSQVQDACLPALHSNGFAVIQPLGRDEHGDFVETVFLHESGWQTSGRAYLIIGKNDMQGYGSAVTYARRYGLASLAGITDEDDDGNAAARAAPKPATAPPPKRAATSTADSAVPLSQQAAATAPRQPSISPLEIFIGTLDGAKSLEELQEIWSAHRAHQSDAGAIKAKDRNKARLAASDLTLQMVRTGTFGG